MVTMNSIHPTLKRIVAGETKRQLTTLDLIASENYTSPAVRALTGSVLTHKYAEGKARKRYYAGCEFVDQAEELAIVKAKKLFGATWANVQPHSGSQANLAVYQALLQPGDTIMGLDLKHGGHLTHGSSVNASGKIYKSVSYQLDPKTELLDYKAIAKLAKQHKPKIIVCGGSAYSHDWDYKALRKIADSVGAILLADIAHPAGLIAGGHLKNPINDAHIVTTTTHKTLRGPRGGMILVGKDMLYPLKDKNATKTLTQWLDSSVFPGTQGGPLTHVIAAKAQCFIEALQPSFKRYGKNIIQNAKTLSTELKKRGYRIISGSTDNHCFLLDVSAKGLTGAEAESRLEAIGILVNKNLIPFDPKPAKETSGIRLGTPTLTTRGMNQAHMKQIAGWIDTALQTTDTKKQKQLTKTVETFAKRFPLFKA